MIKVIFLLLRYYIRKRIIISFGKTPHLQWFTGGLYYKHIMIVNDDSGIVNKFEASVTANPRVIIYDRHMF